MGLYAMQSKAMLLESSIIEILNFSELLSPGPSPVLELKAFDSELRQHSTVRKPFIQRLFKKKQRRLNPGV